MFFFNMRDQVAHPCRIIRKIMILYIPIFTLFYYSVVLREAQTTILRSLKTRLHDNQLTRHIHMRQWRNCWRRCFLCGPCRILGFLCQKTDPSSRQRGRPTITRPQIGPDTKTDWLTSRQSQCDFDFDRRTDIKFHNTPSKTLEFLQ
jgi:hypothetical protein